MCLFAQPQEHLWVKLHRAYPTDAWNDLSYTDIPHTTDRTYRSHTVHDRLGISPYHSSLILNDAGNATSRPYTFHVRSTIGRITSRASLALSLGTCHFWESCIP